MFFGKEYYTAYLEFALASPQEFLIAGDDKVWQELLAFSQRVV